MFYKLDRSILILDDLILIADLNLNCSSDSPSVIFPECFVDLFELYIGYMHFMLKMCNIYYCFR